MYIQFDPSKMRYHKVKFKGVTQALGGSVRILDEDHYRKTEEEVFHRIAVPLAIVRAFQMRHHNPKFLRPTEGAIIYYDQRPIGLELAPAFMNNERIHDAVTGKKEWTTRAETNFRKAVKPSMFDGRWLFDGIYAYTFNTSNLVSLVRMSSPYSKDGKFRDVRCDCVNMTQLSVDEVIAERYKEDGSKKKKARYTVENLGDVERRSCLAYIADESTFVVTPPIWKELTTVGDHKHGSTKKGDIDDDQNSIFAAAVTLDALDSKAFINLQFALSAAVELSKTFGYDSIAPLQLPELMIQLNTVNLPRIVKEVKATHDIGLTFMNGLAWLLGLLHRATNEEQVNTIRRMLKYLTTKGFYLKSHTDPDKIHKKGVTPADIPMLTPEDALSNFNGMSNVEWNIIRDIARAKTDVIDILSRDRSM